MQLWPSIWRYVSFCLALIPALLPVVDRPLRASNDDILLIQNEAHRIVLRYRVPTLDREPLELESGSFITLNIPGTGITTIAGAPCLPVKQVWLAVPPGAQPVLTGASSYGASTVPGIPVPCDGLDPLTGQLIPAGAGDPRYYAMSGSYPEELVELIGPESFRDLDIIRLLIHPCRFQSTESVITTIDSIDIQVDLSGGNPGGMAKPRELEDDFLSGLICNWSGPATGWRKPAVRQTDAGENWPAGDVYKIGIDASGVYKLSYNYLVNSGIDASSINPLKIRMFNNGGRTLPQDLISTRPDSLIEIAILVSGEEDGSFDPGDEIWFYGRSVHDWEPAWNAKQDRYSYKHYRNPYTDRNIYWLSFDPDGPDGKRMASLGSVGNYSLSPTSTFAYYFDDRENYAIYDDYNLPLYMPNLYGDLFSGQNASRTYTIPIADLIDDEASIVLSFQSIENIAHQYAVYFNNIYIGNTIAKAYSLKDTIEIGPGVLLNGNNSLRIEHITSGTAYLDYFEFEYKRSLTVTTGDIMVCSPASNGLAEIRIDGLQNPWSFDITDYADVRCVQAGEFMDSCSLYDPRRYYACESGAISTPVSFIRDTRSADEYSHLRSTLGADVLVITADEFYDDMEAYEYYREHEAPFHMQVLRVKISDIFDEYGWGLPDPVAIRNFLKSTLPPYNWAVSPLYVLFAGDGDWDYRNKLLNTDNNWIIPFVDGNRCTDDWYGYLAPSDDVYSYPQFAMGRWPVQSATQIDYMIERTRSYESMANFGPWRNRVVFVADDEFGPMNIPSMGESTHVRDTETLAESYFPAILNKEKIYLTDYPVSYDPAGGGRRKPEAAEDLMDAINDGCLLVNYMGHGNPTVWAHEHVFLQSRDLPIMTNGDCLPLFVAATCDWSYWDSPFSQSMPEVMCTMQQDGAIATIAATRTTTPSGNRAFLQNLYTSLFEIVGSRRLGDALMRSKISAFVHQPSGGSTNTNTERYNLLGDPVIQLNMPQMVVDIDMGSIDTLTALETTTIQGQLKDLQGNPLTSFDGIAHVQLFDINIPVTYELQISSEDPEYLYYELNGNRIFRGDVSVKNGAFEANFVVPVDISYGGSGGRLSIYASSDYLDGAGSTDELVFNESAVAIDDTIPPAINIYFDSPGFREGDLVGDESVLFVEVADSTGINLTGSVGHGITINIDGGNPIDLTNNFVYYLDSHTVGRAEYQFEPGELSNGTHELEAIAWDAANNPNVSRTTFTVVGSGSGLQVYDVLNFPNPMKRETRFTFCLTGTAVVTIKIYTVAGRLLKIIDNIPGEASFNYTHPRLTWDGCDEQGDPVSNGVYLYKVKARSPSGETGDATGRLIVMR